MSTSVSFKANPLVIKVSAAATLLFYAYYSFGSIQLTHPVGAFGVAIIGILFGLLQVPCILGTLFIGALYGSELTLFIGALLGPGAPLWLLSTFAPVRAMDFDHAFVFGIVCVALAFVAHVAFRSRKTASVAKDKNSDK